MKPLFLLLAICLGLSACDQPTQQSSDDQSVSATTGKPVSIDSDTESNTESDTEGDFEWSPESFADIKIIRY